MMRSLLLVLVAGCVVGEADTADRPPKQVSLAAPGQAMAALAATSGRITTLATYAGGGAHPGQSSIDIGAPGGALVHHQLDFVPASIAGGWVFVREAHEAGLCSAFYPGHPSYNGAKVYVTTYFYDTSGGFVGSNTAAFQHVDVFAPNMNTWWAWNNAAASTVAWASGANFTYGGGSGDGLYLGTVTPVPSPIYNTNGRLCTDGSHVHQENDGARAPQRYPSEAVTDRYSDLHYFQPAAGMPAGAPPHAPSPGSAPAPAGPASTGCNGLTYEGACSDNLLTWCEAEVIRTVDCSSIGKTCGYAGEAIGFDCL